MKVIVAGSRGITDAKLVHGIIDRCPFQITEIVSGGAMGVDKMGESWATDHKVPIKSFTPHYQMEDPRVAPLLRNIDMANYADALVAVWKDGSHGTKHMIDQMQKLQKLYVVIEMEGNEIVREWGNTK
jgi:hypothetical protein